MNQGQAKTYWAAVVLHVQGVVRKAESLGEVIHDFGVMIERVREVLRIRPFAVSKARIIGRNEVIAIGNPSEERLEHPRG